MSDTEAILMFAGDCHTPLWLTVAQYIPAIDPMAGIMHAFA